MNSTQLKTHNIKDYYIVCSFSAVFALSSVIISGIILILVWRTKPRLYQVRYLLTCNTCIASIFYCIVQSNNYAFLIFLPWQTSDVGCRWRGYFAYITLCGVSYSFLIQALSRLFISIFSTKYRWLVTFKVHYILISLQWFLSMVIPLPAIITKDIYFRPNALCWVPLKNTIHVAYTYIVYYIIPGLSVCMTYVFIYIRVHKMTNRPGSLARSIYKDKRDLELLRNILIFLGIYLIGGVPTLLFLVTSNTILYLIGIVTISLTVAIEKVCTILLDRELRQVIRNSVLKPTQITPLGNGHATAKYQGNVIHNQRIVVQPSVHQ